jgi:deoxyribodipyrimidine photo-lyase
MATPQILWFRQDLRLADQAAVRAAAAAGPVLPVYVLDDESPGLRPIGGASRWWLHHSLAALDSALKQMGGALLLLKGPSASVLGRLAAECGAGAVHALRHSEPWWRAIEAQVPGLQIHGGVTLVPPGLLRTKTGGRFHMFTPFWRAHVALGQPAQPEPAPERIDFAPLPQGERLEALGLLPLQPDWAKGFDWRPGEAAAQAALAASIPALGGYDRARNFPSEPGTSRLSPHLHFGELSPGAAWHAAVDALGEEGAAPWTRQLVWRDFAHETLDQFPDSAEQPHRGEFNRLPWTDVRTTDGRALLRAWQRGHTGYPLVDAGMRQLWATGWMHNRVRMVAASFLVKHLLIDWRAGERWFWDTLVDADAANNAMGWQWVMGSGVDSAPYFRIFTPVGQSAKFDAGGYIRRWVPELRGVQDSTVHGPFPAGCNGYPPPMVDHGAARARALTAYAVMKA